MRSLAQTHDLISFGLLHMLADPEYRPQRLLLVCRVKVNGSYIKGYSTA